MEDGRIRYRIVFASITVIASVDTVRSQLQEERGLRQSLQRKLSSMQSEMVQLTARYEEEKGILHGLYE